MPEPRYRAATPGDVADIAILADIAGDGMPVLLWLDRARPGQSSLEIARERALRTDGAFSYRNAQLATLGQQVVGLMLGYPLVPRDDLADPPPAARPLIELENEVPGHWYLNMLAVYAEFRGQGIDSRLLQLADAIGRQHAPGGLAIIVASDNGSARRLYERHGYREKSRRKAVLMPGGSPTPEWVLLRKPHG